MKTHWLSFALAALFVAGAPAFPAPADDASRPTANEEPSALDAIDLSGAIEVPAPKSAWVTIGGPIALVGFFALVLLLNKVTVPFILSQQSLNLHDYPTGVKRGLALAVVLFGVAFLLGAFEIVYQVRLNGSSEAYFQQMSHGKMLAFTHAHLFGFTTSFLVIGIPFSMQFNHISAYQWIFPIGLAACLVDIMSWWGLKYLSGSFLYLSIACGVVFSLSYLYMLAALLRVLLFPQITLPSDKDFEERRARRRGGSAL